MSAFQQAPSATLGTTPWIRIPKEQKSGDTTKLGEGYFEVTIHGAQAAVYGPFWQRAQQLVVTSEVKLNCPPFNDEALKSIRRIHPIRQGTPKQLGLGTNLVELTPANMERVTITIEFLLDQKNRLSMLADLANDGAFMSAISVAPGAAAAAKSVASLSKKIINMFLDDTDGEPILKFVGDFSLTHEGISDAYYVILGSRYDKYPLPRPLPSSPVLQVQGRELLYNAQPVTNWSYVILNVSTVEARTKALGRGEPWYEKLNQVDVLANQIQRNPLARDKDRRQTWANCLSLLKEADTLLRIDPAYLPKEAESIIQEAYVSAQNKILPRQAGLGAPPTISAEERSFLNVASEDELQSKITVYTVARSRSQEKLRQIGLLK